MAPEVYALVPKRRRKVRTVRHALVDRTWILDIAGAPSALALWQYVQLWSRLNTMDWVWTTDGQCSTGERLARRGLPHAPECPLCDQSEETMTHLLTWCSFSRTVWFEVLSWIRSTYGPPSEGHFVEWWSQVVRTAPRQLRKGTSSIIMLTVWWIWKNRNAAIFDNAQLSVPSLLSDIKTEAQQWANAGARGVRQFLP
ncbi:uncharacterized protein [Lolium perenne]|uniref:uncharacterized protein n=1 Tax=Lolium perenne TaxID=4522 RepID=UPI003A9908A7